MLKPQKLSFFVTGTDTGVGKTLVTTALLHALAKHHPHVVGMKPVAAGTTLIQGTEANDDVLALRAASSCRVPPSSTTPCCCLTRYRPTLPPRVPVFALT